MYHGNMNLHEIKNPWLSDDLGVVHYKGLRLLRDSNGFQIIGTTNSAYLYAKDYIVFAEMAGRKHNPKELFNKFKVELND